MSLSYCTCDVSQVNVPVARRVSVVPVSVIPEVAGKTVVPSGEPKVMVWSIPTNWFAGEVEVIGL